MLKKSKRIENRGLHFRKRIAYGYLLMVAIGTFFLFSSLSNKDGHTVSLIDAFFVAASAFSDTGLTPVNTAETFNFLGQIIILILMQVGGIGIMSIKVILFMFIGKKISIEDRLLVQTEQGQTTVAGMVKFIKEAIAILFIVQMLFTVVMSAHMMIFYDYNFLDSIWFGYFHTTAALTNSGFDITGNSFISFATDYTFQIYIMLLIVIGGLGFPVLIDLKRYFKSKKTKTKFRFSLFSKVSVTTYLVCTVLGFVLICLSDYNFIFNEVGGIKGIFYVLFQVISARNAGFSTFDLAQFSQGSQLVLSVLMFIGAAPASTGGGIRTTTLAVIMIYLYNSMSNKKDIEVFNRRLPLATVVSAFTSMVIAVFIVVFASYLLVSLDNDTTLVQAIFEVCSGFGTTGLTLGLTPHLGFVSKLVVTIVMIIGQVGIINTLVVFGTNKEKSNFVRLPEEDITIG